MANRCHGVKHCIAWEMSLTVKRNTPGSDYRQRTLYGPESFAMPMFRQTRFFELTLTSN